MASYALSFSLKMRKIYIFPLISMTIETLENSVLSTDMISCSGRQQDKF